MSARKRAKTSYLWSHFTIQNPAEKVASCDYCGELLKYKATVSNLKKHIQRRHRMIVLPINSNVKIENNDNFEDPGSSGFPNSPDVCITSEIAANQTSDFPAEKQENTCTPQGFNLAAVKSNENSSSKPSESQKLDKLLLQLFIYDYQPFSIVEDEGFINFVKGLNPSYKLPDKENIINCMLPAEYDKCFTVVSEELQAVHSVCLTTDIWISENLEIFLGVTAHYITETFELRPIFLDCSLMPESPTSANLAELIQGIMKKFNLIYKVLAVVSNDDANITGAVTDEIEKEHVVCFAHTLNRILQDALKIPKELIDKIRSIVNYLKGSSSALEKLDSAQKMTLDQEPQKLIQDDPARWNSTLYMIQRFSELEDAIKTTIAWINKNLPVLTEDEWTACKELAIVLEPFEDVTKEISDEHYVMGSLIIPLTNGLRSVCEKMREETFGPIARCVIDELLKGINTRMVKIEDNNSLALATFLDPRFKLVPFSSESSAQSIKEHCTSLMAGIWVHQQNTGSTDTTTDDSSNKDEVNSNSSKVQQTKFSVWESLDNKIASRKSSGSMSAAIVEVNRYLEDAFLGRKEDPLLWWKKNEHYYPLMGRVVKTKFNIMGTSLPCERLFTKEGALITKRRSRLQTKNIGKILFLNANSYLIY